MMTVVRNQNKKFIYGSARDNVLEALNNGVSETVIDGKSVSIRQRKFGELTLVKVNVEGI